ncbi:hypothetical protein, partial [Pasteurella multocida]|uniref:hypothetical protein n=1 Tax=Pasteurella multocida TaxID=747 RepID=UPI0035E43611
RAGRRSDLYRALRWAVARGKQSPERRGCLASWAHCVTGPAGASYLLDILACSDLGAPAPIPPWRAAGPAFAAGNN